MYKHYMIRNAFLRYVTLKDSSAATSDGSAKASAASRAAASLFSFLELSSVYKNGDRMKLAELYIKKS